MRYALPLTLTLSLLLAACGGDAPTPPVADSAPATAAPEPAPEPQASVDASLEPLFGAWAIDAANCATPIRITETSFEGRENVCEITGWTSDGEDVHTATMTCTGEGQTATERIAMTPIFGPQGEGIRLNYVDRGGDPVAVFRCAAANAP